MRKLAILTFQTLDGVMQAPSMPEEDYSGGFQQSGWAAPYWEEVMAQVGEYAMNKPYDLLLGRKTYDLFEPHWTDPANDGPAARRMRDARKYIVTNSPRDFKWENSHALKGDALPEEILELKKTEGPLLQVHGSWQLIQSLLAHDLVDELRLWTFPLLVGQGKRLFETAAPNRFELQASDHTENGVRMSLYRKIPV